MKQYEILKMSIYTILYFNNYTYLLIYPEKLVLKYDYKFKLKCPTKNTNYIFKRANIKTITLF